MVEPFPKCKKIIYFWCWGFNSDSLNFICVGIWDRVGLCSSVWLRTQYVAQTGLQFTSFLSPLSTGVTGVHHHSWLPSLNSINKIISRMWHTLVIPALQEAEGGRSQVWNQPGQLRKTPVSEFRREGEKRWRERGRGRERQAERETTGVLTN